MSHIETNPAVELFQDSHDVVADVVKYARLSSGLASLRESIAARIKDVIAASGVATAKALKDLKTQVIEAGLDPRRASEVFIELGFRERAEKAESESKKERDEKLAPVIEKLIALAKNEAGDDAGRALRRAYLTLNSEKAAA
jgi:hypothetical protein